MNLRTVSEPEFEPVTLAEARLWCRVDDDNTAEDAMLLLLIGASRRYAENLTGRAFVQRQLELRLDCFPSGKIELPVAPVRSVDLVQYLDGDGVLRTLSGSPTEYQEDTGAVPAWIAPLYAGAWPATRSDYNAVRVRFTAGYASRSALPPNVRIWMQARLATLFRTREQLARSGTIQIPRDFCDGLLDDLVLASRFFA